MQNLSTTTSCTLHIHTTQ